MSFLLYITFFVFLWGHFMQADAAATNHSVQRGHTSLFQGPYDTSNIKLLHFEGKSYYLGTTFKTSFLQASMFCQMIHMQLVSIYSAAESDRLYRYIMDTFGAGNNFWSSGSRLVDGRTWLWLSSGETMKYTNWVPTQPDNTNNNERCIELAPENHGLYWNDIACEKSDYFICEKYDDPPHKTDDSNKSIDKDKCQTEEANDQLLPATTGIEKKYRVAKIKATQGEASQTCKQYGMELVSIPNKKTNDIITNLVSQYNKTGYWTSGIRQSSGGWVWWDHRPLVYTNWAPKEPNNKNKIEFCLHLLPNGKWNDGSCVDKLFFICETFNVRNFGYCEPQPVNVYVNNNFTPVTNGSEIACSCNGEKSSTDNDDPFFPIQPRTSVN